MRAKMIHTMMPHNMAKMRGRHTAMASSAWTGWPGPPRVSRMRAPTQAGSRSGPSPNPGPFSTDAPTHSEKISAKINTDPKPEPFSTDLYSRISTQYSGNSAERKFYPTPSKMLNTSIRGQGPTAACLRAAVARSLDPWIRG